MQSAPLIAFDLIAFRVGLARRGYRSVAALAAHLGIHRNRMNAITHGLIPEPELRERIAAELKVTPGELWTPVQPVPVQSARAAG